MVNSFVSIVIPNVPYTIAICTIYDDITDPPRLLEFL